MYSCSLCTTQAGCGRSRPPLADGILLVEVPGALGQHDTPLRLWKLARVGCDAGMAALAWASRTSSQQPFPRAVTSFPRADRGYRPCIWNSREGPCANPRGSVGAYGQYSCNVPSTVARMRWQRGFLEAAIAHLLVGKIKGMISRGAGLAAAWAANGKKGYQVHTYYCYCGGRGGARGRGRDAPGPCPERAEDAEDAETPPQPAAPPPRPPGHPATRPRAGRAPEAVAT